MERYTENSGINSGWPRLLPSPIPPSPSLGVLSPKSGQRIRETYKPQSVVMLRVSTQISRFRYPGWIGEPGGHRQGPYVCEYSEVPFTRVLHQSFIVVAPPSSFVTPGSPRPRGRLRTSSSAMLVREHNSRYRSTRVCFRCLLHYSITR